MSICLPQNLLKRKSEIFMMVHRYKVITTITRSSAKMKTIFGGCAENTYVALYNNRYVKKFHLECILFVRKLDQSSLRLLYL